MAPPPQSLEAIRRAVADGGPPRGVHPKGDPGSQDAALPNPLPIAKRLKNSGHIQSDPNAARRYGSLQQDEPHPTAIPPLDVPISIPEICIFFPAWLIIPDVAARVTANGWDRGALANIQLDAKNNLSLSTKKTVEDRIQKQMSDGGKLYANKGNEKWDKAKFIELVGPQNDLTANNWELRSKYTGTEKGDWSHIPLVDVWQHIPANKWPTGSDRKLLTRCLEFASQNTHLDLDTSHWHLIINSQGFAVPAPGTFPDSGKDKAALARLQARVSNPTT